MKSILAIIVSIVAISLPLRAEPLEILAPSEGPLALSFVDENGNAVDLTNFEGQYTIVNFWATWCAPCVAEMPSLDRLQAEIKDHDATVVAISLDRGDRRKLRKFYDELELTSLDIYHDEDSNARKQLRIAGLPLTIVLDGENREIARHLGPNEWDAPALIEQVRQLGGS